MTVARAKARVVQYRVRAKVMATTKVGAISSIRIRAVANLGKG